MHKSPSIRMNIAEKEILKTALSTSFPQGQKKKQPRLKNGMHAKMSNVGLFSFSSSRSFTPDVSVQFSLTGASLASAQEQTGPTVNIKSVSCKSIISKLQSSMLQGKPWILTLTQSICPNTLSPHPDRSDPTSPQTIHQQPAEPDNLDASTRLQNAPDNSSGGLYGS